MKRVPMPPDTNEKITKIKRSMAEAWPGFDENLFREQLKEADENLERYEARLRAQNRFDFFVNVVIAIGFFVAAILLVSGKL